MRVPLKRDEAISFFYNAKSKVYKNFNIAISYKITPEISEDMRYESLQLMAAAFFPFFPGSRFHRCYSIEKKKARIFSSVITIAEVLPKPLQLGKKELASKFIEFLKNGENLSLIVISADIAEKAGQLRGKYPKLKALDAIQLASAIMNEVDAFLANDVNLKQVSEIKIVLLRDFLQ